MYGGTSDFQRQHKCQHIRPASFGENKTKQTATTYRLSPYNLWTKWGILRVIIQIDLTIHNTASKASMFILFQSWIYLYLNRVKNKY